MIKMEFYKLRKQRIFYVILLFVGVISVMSSISAMSLDVNLNGKTQYVEMFHDVSMLFACAVFVALYIGNDFNSRTIQYQVASGHSRKDIIIAKLLGFMVASQMIIILYPVIGAITVTINRGWDVSVSCQEIKYIILTLIESIVLNIGTSSYFVLFAFVCRDITKTICLSVAFPIVLSIIKPFIAIIPILRYLIDLMSISQIGNIGITSVKQLVIILLSSTITLLIDFFIMTAVFYKAELK
jgi:ABC-2 type transport system permease protein